MIKRDLESALSYGAGVREHANDHCAMCESPQDEGDRKHSERYHLQYQSDVYCAILAEEVERLRKEQAD